jgi:hypothetical protein
MTKEEILELMKWLILELRDHEEELKTDTRRRADWTGKSAYMQSEVAKLNSCDLNWLNDEYGKWASKEVTPYNISGVFNENRN